MASTASGMVTGNKSLNIGLWAAQFVLAALYATFGSMKLFQPIDHLAEMMKWVTTLPPWFVRSLGTAELLGAAGLILPSLTRILPRLTILAALCFVVLQVLAIGLHLSRGEPQVLGLNAVLIGLALFVLWGRSSKVVIPPR